MVRRADAESVLPFGTVGFDVKSDCFGRQRGAWGSDARSVAAVFGLGLRSRAGRRQACGSGRDGGAMEYGGERTAARWRATVDATAASGLGVQSRGRHAAAGAGWQGARELAAGAADERCVR